VANVLGLILFVVYVLVIVGAAAGVTWIVVRFTPSRRKADGAAQS
jgi:H+/Cl- antiporter ClcA